MKAKANKPQTSAAFRVVLYSARLLGAQRWAAVLAVALVVLPLPRVEPRLAAVFKTAADLPDTTWYEPEVI